MNGPHLAVLMHDGFYCAGTGAGYANHASLDVLARNLAPHVNLHVLPVHLAPASCEYDPAWHRRTLDTLAQHPLHHVHSLDNGTDAMVRFSGLPAFQTLAISSARALSRVLPTADAPALIIAFDVPFLGVPALLPAALAQNMITVPRSSALLHAPDDRERIAYERQGLQTAASRSGRIGAISAHMRRHLHHDLDVPEESLIDLPDGLTAADRRFAQPQDRLLPTGAREHGFILSMGRAQPYKGWDDLLDAMGLLKSRTPTVPPLLLAAVTEDPRPSLYQQHLKRRIEQENLPVCLRTRFDHRIRDLLAHPLLRVVVVPSRAEPFGRIPLEAFTAGMAPVVSTTAGGLAEQVLDGITGYTAPPGDPRGLAGAVHRALDCTTADRARLSQAARQLAHERHDHEAALLRTLRETAPWALREPVC